MQVRAGSALSPTGTSGGIAVRPMAGGVAGAVRVRYIMIYI
jgi:hypothetical protein